MTFPRSRDRSERRWSALALIVTAQFMVILDVAIVNVALPSIKTDLGFSQASLQWVISAYAIFFGGDAAARRPARRPARPPAALRRRPRALRGQLAALRPRLVGGLADRVPRAPGPRRRAARAGRALAPDDDVRRGPRAQPRARHLRRRVRQRRRRGRAARRRAHLVPELVVDLLRQRPGRHRRDRARRRCCCARAAPTLAHRHFDVAGADVDHGRADAARLRDDARDDRRLGLADDARRCSAASAALVARVRRDRAALDGAAAAAADLPARARSSAANATMAIVGAVAFSEFFLLTLYLQDVLHYSAVQSGVAFTGVRAARSSSSRTSRRRSSAASASAPTLTAGLLRLGRSRSPG